MVTTTTKVLNYTIERGPSKNIVSATITSTPGVNVGYLTKLAGILKLLELILTIVGFALILSLVRQHRYPMKDIHGFILPESVKDYSRETILSGEMYFLCIHYTVLTVLVIFITTYFISLVSEVVITKTSQVDIVMNLVMALLLLIAGIVLLVMTVQWTYDREWRVMVPHHEKVDGKDRYWQDYVLMVPQNSYIPTMHRREWGVRIAAGVIALVNAILFVVSFVLSRKEFNLELRPAPAGYVPAPHPMNTAVPLRSEKASAALTTTTIRHSPDEF